MIHYENVFLSHRDRYCSKWQHYFDIYDRHLSHLINKKFTLLEIGIAGGGSLQIWKKYFGDKVNIIGIDINSNCFFEESQIKTFIGDQTDTHFLASVLKDTEELSVIVDDGSHVQSHIMKSFDYLYPKLSDEGTYIIEDCHTAYWPRFEGGLDSTLNVVNTMSNCCHDVNHKWYNKPKQPSLKNLDSIHFYDSVIVLEKNKSDVKRHMIDVNQSGVKIMESI